MKKKNINNKNLIIILALILITLVGIAGTYALFTWTSTENTELTMSIGNVADVVFINGPDITTSLTPVFNYTDGEKTTIQIKKKNENPSGIKYTINLNITSIDTPLIDSTFKYKLLKENDIVAEGDFSGASNGTVIELENDYLFNTTNFTFYLYIDSNEENSSDMMNSKFTGTISMTAENILTASQTITNLYLNNKTGTVTNNNITYNVAAIYDNGDDDATTNSGLINDRLGGSTTNLDGGNIRYYGANPNNYIYFNCNDYSNQSSATCEVWRIIGVFDNKVKIVRMQNIGNNSIYNRGYDWDCDYNNENNEVIDFNNDWTRSSLNTLLNESYYNNVDITYYSCNSGEPYPLEANFKTKKIGLKNNETRNMIETVTWTLGGYSDSDVFSDEIYRYERGTDVYDGNETTWPGKIALMYASDYGYATDFNNCSQTLYSYNTLACNSNNWLYKGNGEYWLLNHDNSYLDYAWTISERGLIYYDADVTGRNVVYPTLYLKADEIFEGGDGSENNPYKLLA